MIRLALTLPGPPAPKTAAAKGRAGHYYRKSSKKQSAAAEAILDAMLEAGGDWPVSTAAHTVIYAVKPRPRHLSRKKDPTGRIWCPVKPDADNISKLMCDALKEAGAWMDDNLVVNLQVMCFYAAKGEAPCVELMIAEPGEPPQGAPWEQPEFAPELEPAAAEDEAGFHGDEAEALPTDAAALYDAMTTQKAGTPNEKAAFRALLAEYQRIVGTGQPLLEWFDEADAAGALGASIDAILSGEAAPAPTGDSPQLALLGAMR